jgi:hypothetical protein
VKGDNVTNNSSPGAQPETAQLEEFHATCIEAATLLSTGGVVYDKVDDLRQRLQKMEKYFQQKLRQMWSNTPDGA